jgi:hypothetical protein
MPRKRAAKRGRSASIVAAAGIGFLFGCWTASAVRSTETASATPAEMIAQRFPQNLDFAAVPQPVAARYVAAVTGTVATDQQAWLFDPEPMVPTTAQNTAQNAATTAKPAEPAVRLAEAEPEEDALARVPASVPSSTPAALPVRSAPILAPAPAGADQTHAPKVPIATPKPRIAAVHHRPERQGIILDNAQIAGIRRELHLTADQERMWPGVAQALRNIGRVREREAHGGRELRPVDPNSTEVQDLKYAAIPLLMSFDDQQKDEVRNLAHRMGLDQLASQF